MTPLQSREEVEAAYSGGGNLPRHTRREMIQLAKTYFGLRGMADFFRKHELVEFFSNPDWRPTLLAVAELRQRAASEARESRRRAIAKGLERRPGKWRFVAMAHLPPHTFFDEILGSEVKGGLMLRDTRTRGQLAVGYTTATEMKRRRRLMYYDRDRLPVATDAEAGAENVDRIDTEIEEILNSFQNPAL